MAKRKHLIFILILFLSRVIVAGHPLRTDDTGTIGKQSLQLELTPEIWKYTDDHYFFVPFTSTYGMVENVDIVLTILYSSLYISGFKSSLSGVNDVGLEVKWRLAQFEKLSFALKPGLILPVGDYRKALGTGKLGYSLFLIADQDLSTLLLHLNIGYIRNENRLQERTNLWLISIAAEIPVAKSLSLVAEVGASTNNQKTADGHPVFVLAGAIYSIANGIDIDIGLQKGVNKHETDLAILTGLTVVF